MKSKTLFAALLPCCFSAWMLLGPLSIAARADSVYTYQGNPFTTYPTGLSCPPVCSVMGSFTIASSLAPNLNLAAISPISFAISADGTIITDEILADSDSSLNISTDGMGNITNWGWRVLGPAGNPTERILTQNISGAVYDTLHRGTSGPPFAGPVVAEIFDSPGTWTETAATAPTPEPAGLTLYGTCLLCLLIVVRNKRPDAESDISH